MLTPTLSPVYATAHSVSETTDSPEFCRQSVLSLAGKTLRDIERQAIMDTLRACRGNKAKSARMLGISEKSIYNKMRRLGLSLNLPG